MARARACVWYAVPFAREQVSNELRQLLQEKESLLDEAAGLFREAESVNAARREAFLAEKADIESDLEVGGGRDSPPVLGVRCATPPWVGGWRV